MNQNQIVPTLGTTPCWEIEFDAGNGECSGIFDIMLDAIERLKFSGQVEGYWASSDPYRCSVATSFSPESMTPPDWEESVRQAIMGRCQARNEFRLRSIRCVPNNIHSIGEHYAWYFGALGFKHGVPTSILQHCPCSPFMDRAQPRFRDELKFIRQLFPLRRQKLTKAFFLGLPVGCFVTSNLGNFSISPSPGAQRTEQWRSIPSRVRQRLCDVFRNEAHYEAMMDFGRDAAEDVPF